MASCDITGGLQLEQGLPPACSGSCSIGVGYKYTGTSFKKLGVQSFVKLGVQL